MYDLVIKNANIYDGTGEAAYVSNVGVKDGKIAKISKEDLGISKETVNADGLALSSGFIDAHSHSDYAVTTDPHRLHVLRMGVTTEVAGQCGSSISPTLPDMPKEARAHFEKMYGKLYPDLRTQIEALEKTELGTNQRYFCGHNVVRGNVMGLESRAPTESEFKKMSELIEASVRQGAAGLSTGLSYVPGIYCNGDELVELSRAAAKASGMYTTHSRSESMGLFDSVEECIRIAREANIPVNISHFKCVGKVFWERCEKALSMIDEAIAEGLDITLDAYPYIATSTTTLSVIPPKFLTSGGAGLAKMLHDTEVVEAIRREIYEINDPSWDNSMYYVGLEKFLIVKAEKTPQFVGKTYVEAAKELGLEPF
jgi:N-acyl-D-amino-acid deacylase